MIPLSTTLAREQNEVPKSVSLFTGLGLIIGMCIGSGIFASPGPILARTGSGWAALSVWIAGGGLCLLGSSCYAELGSSIPGNGGEFLYLLKAFGTLPAFLFSWTNITVTRPAAVAVIAVVFGEYATRLMGLESVIATRMIAVFLIWSLTAVNCFSSKLGAIVQDVFTIMKLISLLVIGFVGIRFLFNGQGAHNFDSEALARTSKNPGDYAIALYTALWAYDGWNNLNLVTGELRNPEKNLPRAVTIGPSIVIFCYLLVNVSYYSVLPADLVSKSNSIAVVRTLFWPRLVFPYPLIVLGSTLGACNATIFTGSRVTSTSSKHGHSPKFLGTLHTKFRTPVNALILQAVLSSAFCSAASFSPLVTFFSDIAWLFYLLTVASLLRLRVTEPYLERPFRVWIGAPIIFCAVTTGMITLSLIERPVEGLCATLFMLSGVPVWWVAFKSGWTAPDDLQDLMHKVSVPLRILRRNRNGVASASTAWPLGVKKSQQPLSNVPEMSTSTSSEQL
ncbi:amino acid permease-domain-containing protein [Chytridium lagenaria]|nr:amino acid permease-domain-containing protein [Chytridium lagenaria]